MERVYLEFREGTSDKFYRIIAVEDSGGQWITTVWWGRRGSTGQTQLKYIGPSQIEAVACMHDIANQKRAKGYHDALDPLRPAAPASSPAPTPAPVAPAPVIQTLTIPGVPRFPAMKAGEREVAWTRLGPTDFVMEEKFDGHRAGLTFNPDRTIVIRNVYGEDKGKIQNTPHIEAHLRDVEAATNYDLFEGTLIDGELVGLTLQETTHLLGGSGRTDPRLRFVAFDVPWLAGADLRNEDWLVRRVHLGNLLGSIALGPVTLAEVHAPTKANLQAIWDRGGEGAILKPTASKYVPGGRADWTKLKEHHTADAIITDWEPGNGKYANQLGALVLSQYRDGVLTEVTKVSGMTDAQRKDMSSNWKSWHGRVIEFEYQHKTPASYRHPRFVRVRDDKRQDDCTWEASA